MRLLSLEYQDKVTQWKLQNLEFNDLTLLVGASGVGKTKILNAISELKDIATDRKKEKKIIKWNLKFEIKDTKYEWVGETSLSQDEFIMFESDKKQVSFTREKLVKQDSSGKLVIFDRQDNTFFQGNKVPKIASNKSCIELFSEEEEINPIIQGFRRLYIFDFEGERLTGIVNTGSPKELPPLEQIKYSSAPVIAKLAMVSKQYRDVFNEIKQDYLSVFPTVEDIRFVSVIKKNVEREFEFLELQIKEKGCKWVPDDEISSGMLKTLLYISMLYLVPDESVIIIDEFENSLGVNCIDISFETINPEYDIQFVLTSHHPYIINSIPMKDWKIVSRNKSKVIARDASYYNLGKSKHEAFKQLINLTAYTQGRDV